MPNLVNIIWDLPDDPDGNARHIAEHDVAIEEVEEILNNPRNASSRSRSSGFPITFGWTSTGRYLAVIWESIEKNPRTVKPITAFPSTPPRRKR